MRVMSFAHVHQRRYCCWFVLTCGEDGERGGDSENRRTRNSHGPRWLIWGKQACDVDICVAVLAKGPDTQGFTGAAFKTFRAKMPTAAGGEHRRGEPQDNAHRHRAHQQIVRTGIQERAAAATTHPTAAQDTRPASPLQRIAGRASTQRSLVNHRRQEIHNR